MRLSNGQLHAAHSTSGAGPSRRLIHGWQHHAGDCGAQAASHGGGHRGQRARDERSLSRSSRSGSADAHAGIAHSGPPLLAAAQPLPLINQ